MERSRALTVSHCCAPSKEVDVATSVCDCVEGNEREEQKKSRYTFVCGGVDPAFVECNAR